MSRLPAAKRKEQLLDCAMQLFAAHGYARATTAELAKLAGVTEPIIYRHFESKLDLFVALIERTAALTLTTWERQLAGVNDPSERLRRLIGENPMVSEQGRTAYRVFLQAITEADNPKIKDALTKHIQSVHVFLLREIERAQENHKVTARFSAELLAWLLIHLGMGYGVLSAMTIPSHGTDKSGAHVQDVIARLLVGRTGDKPDA
jgi:AcrR family transcriptional regulator